MKQTLTITKENIRHEWVNGNRVHLMQIFSNLLSNAIKSTTNKIQGNLLTITKYIEKKQGGIYLLEKACEQENSVKIQIEVRDTGIGMSKEFLPTLFDSFSRERNTTVGKVAGTGLGMAIVKKYVDLMGSSIDVKSELGKGTVFTLMLTQKKADENYYRQKSEKTDAADMEISLHGKHILLAEDNDLNAEIAIAILEDTGLIIDRVEDGVQCVNQIEQMPAGTYDMILMDIQMPKIDGYKATQAIRNLPDKGKACIPIIAMTANAFEEDKRDAIAAGMNGHIAKPIQVDKLLSMLAEFIRQQEK